MPPEIRQVRFAARLVSIMSPIVQLLMGEEVVIGQRPSQLLAQSVPISVRRLGKRQFPCVTKETHGIRRDLTHESVLKRGKNED